MIIINLYDNNYSNSTPQNNSVFNNKEKVAIQIDD